MSSPDFHDERIAGGMSWSTGANILVYHLLVLEVEQVLFPPLPQPQYFPDCPTLHGERGGGDFRSISSICPPSHTFCLLFNSLLHRLQVWQAENVMFTQECNSLFSDHSVLHNICVDHIALSKQQVMESLYS